VTPPVDIVRLVTRLNIGGPARQALLLTRELAASHPTLLAVGTPPPEEGELADPAVTPVRVPLVRAVRPIDDVRAALAVRRLLRDSGARILHTHMAKAGTVGRSVAATMSRVSTVHTFHGHVLEGYFRPAIQRAFLTIERRLARRTDILIAISPEIRDELVDLRIGRESQYEVVRLGLDLSRHLVAQPADGRLRETLGLGADVPLVGIVGRLVPIKDHETMFDAIARLEGVHLAVLGDGELRPRLEARAAARGIADRVHFVGWWLDMPSALASLDIVALSSRNEGTPVALIEALACGRPVVSTDVGGVRSVVEDGRTGRLVAAGDGGGLARAIGEIFSSPDRGAVLGQRGRAHVRSRFGQDRLVREIAEIYDGLLARSR